MQANHGKREELMVLGVPAGLALSQEYMPRHNPGSIMIVLATDAPLDSLQLTRLAKRAALGPGSHGHRQPRPERRLHHRLRHRHAHPA